MYRYVTCMYVHVKLHVVVVVVLFVALWPRLRSRWRDGGGSVGIDTVVSGTCTFLYIVMYFVIV